MKKGCCQTKDQEATVMQTFGLILESSVHLLLLKLAVHRRAPFADGGDVHELCQLMLQQLAVADEPLRLRAQPAARLHARLAHV